MSERIYDVLILGAGAAGLAASQRLARAGRKVAVIEARHRVGGRIFTRRDSSTDPHAAPVEMGAEFVHGLPTETREIVERAGLQLQELDGEHLFHSHGVLTTRQRSVGQILEHMMEWVEAQPPGTDATFAHYLKHSRNSLESESSAIRYVEGFNAADHRRISVAALARQQHAENAIEADRVFHIQGGYDQLPNFLLAETLRAGGVVFLDRRATRIEWHERDAAVIVATHDSSGAAFEYRGAQAVITLPLGVLQAGEVRIEPVPEEVLESARSMVMGSVLRATFVFKSRIWCGAAAIAAHPNCKSALGELSFLFSETVPGVWWTPHPDPAPMLVGWVAGPTAAISHEGLRERCLNALASIFAISAEALEHQLAHWHFHDWDADPFSRGSYSYVPAGAIAASARMAEPVGHTLYFAGEHTVTTGHWGTVHGALQSGYAAAARILTGR